MKRYTVVIPETVQDQIIEQVLYIADDSLQNAMAWQERLGKAILRIGQTPGLAVDEPASERLGYTVRKSVFEGTYLIHFVVDEGAKTIRIVNFRHGARLPRRDEP